jgi:hypothetical protein
LSFGPSLLIAIFIISGFTLKLADFFGELGSNNKQYPPAIISALSFGLLISESSYSSSIILGIIVGVTLSKKVNSLNLILGLVLTLLTALILGIQIPILWLLAVISSSSLIDELIHDRYYGYEVSAGAGYELSNAYSNETSDPVAELGLKYARPISLKTQFNEIISMTTPFTGDFGKAYNLVSTTSLSYELAKHIDFIASYLLNATKVKDVIEAAKAGLDKVEIQSDQRVFPVEVSCPRCNHSLADPTNLLDGIPSIRVTVSFFFGACAAQILNRSSDDRTKPKFLSMLCKVASCSARVLVAVQSFRNTTL